MEIGTQHNESKDKTLNTFYTTRRSKPFAHVLHLKHLMLCQTFPLKAHEGASVVSDIEHHVKGEVNMRLFGRSRGYVCGEFKRNYHNL